MSKRDLLVVVLAALCVAAVGGARAGSAIVGATEPTQIMNNLQLVKVALDGAKTASTAVSQYATQIQQYQTQLANLQRLSQLPQGMATDSLRALNDLTRYRGALQQLTGSLGQQQTLMDQRIAEARLSGKDWNGYLASAAADL